MPNNKKSVYLIKGSKQDINNLFKATKILGEINDIGIQKAEFQDCTILSCLTPKQRNILIAAKINGYYDYPKRITSKQLSAKIGLSKATVIEHLRKAENRIMSFVISSY
jgi:predicted DNA binding protein